MTQNTLSYGPILITKGQFKGMVGFYDDDHLKSAIVYVYKQKGYYVMPFSYFIGLELTNKNAYDEILNNTFYYEIIKKNKSLVNSKKLPLIKEQLRHKQPNIKK